MNALKKTHSRTEEAIEGLRGKKVVVMGLASTGVSVARALAMRGIDVMAVDENPDARPKGLEGVPNVAIATGDIAPAIFDAADVVVVSPGVPRAHRLLERARSKGAEVISEIELAYRLCSDVPVVAIAGTNGKTTTTTLMGEILRKSGKDVFVGGNIGTPAIEMANLEARPDVAVLEISSFQLETTVAFNPHVGLLLNITEDHLDRYADFEDYARTKFRLFENQSEKDFAIVNSGDPVIADRLSKGPLTKGTVIPFDSGKASVQDGAGFDGASVVFSMKGAKETYASKDFRLKGLHNIENIMAVIGASRIMGASQADILSVLSGFEGLGHRMEFVRELNNVTYVDDSKGTNIGALVMALRGTKTPVVLIAGGRDKGGDYSVLSELVKDKVRALILIGEAKDRIKEALGGLTKTIVADTFEEAVNEASRAAVAGDTVLLCPACSSFDMFSGYKQRGERFCELVRALK